MSGGKPAVRAYIYKSSGETILITGTVYHIQAAACFQSIIQIMKFLFDGSIVVACINQQGGMKFPSLLNLYLRLWDWCMWPDISSLYLTEKDSVLAYVPSCMN